MIAKAALMLLTLFSLHIYTRAQMHPKKVEKASNMSLARRAFIFSALLASFTTSIVWAAGDSISIGLFIVLLGVFWSSSHSLLKAWRDTE
ncbi:MULTISPECIES: hypothetical protein [unclassified Pseudoalteromonas]|jgi:uncharacterized membrane protein|uniref:hypothetical protein n=1 Tax=unclassified Pseudoalteromonas TaxID=194690 RepID=UPI00386C0F89